MKSLMLDGCLYDMNLRLLAVVDSGSSRDVGTPLPEILVDINDLLKMSGIEPAKRIFHANDTSRANVPPHIDCPAF